MDSLSLVIELAYVVAAAIAIRRHSLALLDSLRSEFSEADELEARMYQHELDHLHGVLMFDRMQPDQRKEALAEFRRLNEAEQVGARITTVSGPSDAAAALARVLDT